MSLVMRMLYFLALVVVAAIYTVTMPPESLSLWSLAKYMIPAGSIGILFVLAKGVLGEGLVKQLMALVLVVAVVMFVSMGLSATGMVTSVKAVANATEAVRNLTSDAVSNLSVYVKP